MKSEAITLEKMRQRQADKEHVWRLLENPVVLRLLSLAVLLYGARTIRDQAGRDNLGMRDISAGLAAIGSACIAADAGISDWKALGAVAAAAGVAVGQGKGGVVAVGRGAWGSGALVEIDPFEFSSILSGLSE